MATKSCLYLNSDIEVKVNIFEQSKMLKEESEQLLSLDGIWQPFREAGQVVLAGSAALDVLVYPDLDVYFDVYNSTVNVPEIFAEVAKKLAKLPEVTTVRLEKALHKKRSFIPKGIYLQIKYQLNHHNWQIDIWHLEDENELRDKLAETDEFKQKINENLEFKQRILEVKNAIKRPDGATPSFASYYVYQAVINKGLIELDDIKYYLLLENIQLSL